MPTRQSPSHSRSSLVLILSASLLSVALFVSLLAVFLIKHGPANKASPSAQAVETEAPAENAPPAVSELESAGGAAQPTGLPNRSETADLTPTGSGAATASKDDDAGPFELTGKDFTSSSYDPPHLEAGGMQLLQHYGDTSASLTLAKPYSQVTIKLKPRPVEGSLPVVKLFLDGVTKAGKHVRVPILDNDPVENDQPTVKTITVEPGQYLASFQFLKSSKEARAHLELHSVRFE